MGLSEAGEQDLAANKADPLRCQQNDSSPVIVTGQDVTKSMEEEMV